MVSAIVLTMSKTRFLDDLIFSLGKHFENHTKFKIESYILTAASI